MKADKGAASAAFDGFIEANFAFTSKVDDQWDIEDNATDCGEGIMDSVTQSTTRPTVVQQVAAEVGGSHSSTAPRADAVRGEMWIHPREPKPMSASYIFQAPFPPPRRPVIAAWGLSRQQDHLPLGHHQLTPRQPAYRIALMNPYIQALSAHRTELMEATLSIENECVDSLAARLATQRADALAMLSPQQLQQQDPPPSLGQRWSLEAEDFGLPRPSGPESAARFAPSLHSAQYGERRAAEGSEASWGWLEEFQDFFTSISQKLLCSTSCSVLEEKSTMVLQVPQDKGEELLAPRVVSQVYGPMDEA